MARLPRFDLPGVPQHVVQRGNNRMPCFLDVEDRLNYLTLLRQACLRHHCAVHAYVLMDNHVHLLVTPSELGAVSRMMQTLGRTYVGQFNGRHGRTGTLWEGRYKSCLVDSDAYLLTCQRYIELNPVRAWIVGEPCAYRWSSHGANAQGDVDALVTPHPGYLQLGTTPEERQRAYRALFNEVLSGADTARIRAYLQQQRVLGADDFQKRVARESARFTQVRPAHRPARTVSARVDAGSELAV